ncbi:hypothetical protein MYK68_04885 [Gordonia sp. PP30]|uniref:hypothetical protein n=1 Tax=Gordonia sp. PP30 TaxID=2935861 RepID=UPI001FFE2EC9|nr:hypothetical protein [Gordonia sp. PP30]UQE75938.1 hypothetical protein MYK68_04885 [Gordonia sp. PP30]
MSDYARAARLLTAYVDRDADTITAAHADLDRDEAVQLALDTAAVAFAAIDELLQHLGAAIDADHLGLGFHQIADRLTDEDQRHEHG